jgi:hypothetical protein
MSLIMVNKDCNVTSDIDHIYKITRILCQTIPNNCPKQKDKGVLTTECILRV